MTAEMIFQGIEQAVRLHQATTPVQLRLRAPVRLRQAARAVKLTSYSAYGNFMTQWSWLPAELAVCVGPHRAEAGADS